MHKTVLALDNMILKIYNENHKATEKYKALGENPLNFVIQALIRHWDSVIVLVSTMSNWTFNNFQLEPDKRVVHKNLAIIWHKNKFVAALQALN